MFRAVHSFLGLAAALLVAFVAATGVWLAAEALIDRAATTAPSATFTVADAARAASTLPGVERLDRKASGAIVATYFENDHAAQAVIDPATGGIAPAPDTSALSATVKNLHRKLLLGDYARMAVGLSALAMAMICLTGLALLARRLGGWRRLAAPIRGSGAQRLHCEVSRATFVGLLLCSVTGVVMSATTFELLPDASRARAASATSSEGSRMAAGEIAGLRATSLADFRGLQFPAQDDATDVYTLTTDAGETIFDAVTGAVLAHSENSAWARVYEVIYTLHTGAFAWPLTLLMGLSSAAAPILAGAGALIWAARRRARPMIGANAAAQDSDTILLVGSEGGTTWGFAETLRKALTDAGCKVHVAAMNDLASSYRAARRLIVLAATYGEGEAPASAQRFLARLEDWRGGTLDVAVLGFGDRQFPDYCAYAERVEAALAAKGLRPVLALTRIDRQSAQTFADWGRELGRAIGVELELKHVPTLPKTFELTLLARAEYGVAVGAPTVLLRFGPADGASLPRFEAGDLVGIAPPGDSVARFYSLGSSRRDGALEICVRKLEGGLCSTFLHALKPGESINAFVRENPGFRPAPGAAPVILIGAGAGVAPLAGFVRSNASKRPMWLYFGARHPDSDFLYKDEFQTAIDDKRLTALRSTFSRTPAHAYVQSALAADADNLRDLVSRGAQILVCGGRDMARGVVETLTTVLAPVGLTVAELKREGRYVEDVY